MNLNEVLTLPGAQNFSDIEYGEENYQIPAQEIDWSEIFIEDTILAMMKTLETDQEKVMFLLMAMGKDGYKFQHKDVARMFKMDYSWYMRKIRAVKSKLLPFLNERLKVSSKNAEKLNKVGETE